MAVLQFTYSFDPATSQRDAVRFLVGDTDERRPLLDDREVDHAIQVYPNNFLSAALLASALESKFAREADVSVGQVSKSLSQVSENFRKKAAQLREEVAKRASVSFLAISISGKQSLECEGDLTKPQFAIGQDDNPFASQLHDSLDKAGFNGF